MGVVSPTACCSSPGRPEACCTPLRPAGRCRRWTAASDWPGFSLPGSGLVGPPAHLKLSASPEGTKIGRVSAVNPTRLCVGVSSASLTLSMLCCSRSFIRTTSCCLNISFSGSGNDGGGVICTGHKRTEWATASAASFSASEREAFRYSFGCGSPAFQMPRGTQ